MAPEAVTRRVNAAVVIGGCLVLACARAAPPVSAAWRIEPAPVIAGAATLVRVTLRRADGTAAAAARLQLEAHMAHPGMPTLTVNMTEPRGGEYEARVRLSMEGDWILVVSGELADGTRLTREFRVAAVRAAG